jgi:hypothetical protein
VLQVHALRASLKFSTLDKYFFLPFFFFLQFLSYPELVFPISDFAYHSELVQLSSPSESVGYLLSSHCAVQASLMAPVYVDNVHLKHSKRSCRYRNIFVYSKQAKEPSLCALQFTISSYNLHLSFKVFLKYRILPSLSYYSFNPLGIPPMHQTYPDLQKICGIHP